MLKLILSKEIRKFWSILTLTALVRLDADILKVWVSDVVFANWGFTLILFEFTVIDGPFVGIKLTLPLKTTLSTPNEPVDASALKP